MTTVLFIHGTGVREPQLTETVKRINAGFQRVRPGLEVTPCYWGQHGAELLAGGASFYFDDARGKTDRDDLAAALDEEQEIVLWHRLLRNPLFEIGLQPGGPSRPKAGKTFTQRIAGLPEAQQLSAKLADCGLTDAFAAAVTTVTSSAEYQHAFANVTTTDADTKRMVARALIAYCLAETGADADLSGDERDELVRQVVGAFGVPDQGWFTDTLLPKAKAEAWWGLHPFMHDKRRKFVDQLADIVFYQTRGEKIREFVADEIGKLPGPVVLLAHSLGGVIAFDLLAGKDSARFDHVQMLITVGSQVPLLYEAGADGGGALTCGLKYPDDLPDSFPAQWINVYDKRDLLAYGGQKFFTPDRCRDVPVNSRVSFPAAHEAYWGTRDFYVQVDKAMREAGL